MQFSKWHGLGNDFIFVYALEEELSTYSGLAEKMCDRHFGIGADGLIVLLPGRTTDFIMRIFNSDGSEAEMCGNAIRCAARYVHEAKLTQKTKITFETHAGIITPEILNMDGPEALVRVDMGEPRTKRSLIPMTGNGDDLAINLPLEVGSATYRITGVSVGNPHCVIFVEDVSKIDLPAIGPLIENHPLFPKKTNVEFVQILDETRLRMRVWERGAGITLACGTGASSVLVAAVLNGKAQRKASVELDGGTLFIEWAADNHVYMSGPATLVFHGEYLGNH